MAGAYAGPIVAVEVLVEQNEVTPVGIVAAQSPCTGRMPVQSGRNVRVRRPEISAAVSHKVRYCPDPVGDSTLKLSPK